MRKSIIALAVTALALTGCDNLTPGEQRAVTGTGIGAAGGAAIDAIAGNAGLGAELPPAWSAGCW
jgi:uncharacterized lipoprotein NlpE involved in copper resistance